MVKRDGVWRETDWQTALEFVVTGLERVREVHGGNAIATLASPHSTLEELYLAQKLTRGLGSENVDFRLRQSDFSADAPATQQKRRRAVARHVDRRFRGARPGAGRRQLPAQGSSAARAAPAPIGEAQRRGLHPAFGRRRAFDHAANQCVVAPSRLPRALAEIVVAAAAGRGPSGAGGARRHRAIRGRESDRREPRRWQGQGHFPRQLRPAASARRRSCMRWRNRWPS